MGEPETYSEKSGLLSGHNTIRLIEPDPNSKAAGGTYAGSVFNLVNTIIGGGLLALPFAFSISGFVLGVILVLLVGALSGLSSHLLIRSSLLLGEQPQAYKHLAGTAFGTIGLYTVEIAQMVFLLGTTTGYIVILGDVLRPFAVRALGKGFYSDTWFVALVLLLAIPYPLSCLGQINSLRFTSFLSVLCISFLVFAIIFRSIQGVESTLKDDDLEFHFVCFSLQVFRTVPLISFAFTFHLQLYSIWNEMKNQSSKSVHVVVISALGICSLTYLLVGSFGYLSFLDTTEDNILKHYEDDILFDVVKILLLFIICCSYPLMAYPMRQAADGLFFDTPSTWKRRVPEATVIAAISYILAVAIGDISTIFGYVGATVGNLLVFILPALFFLRCRTLGVTPAAAKSLAGLCQDPTPIFAVILASCGVIFSLASLYAITAELITDQGKTNKGCY